jgi:V-type H+-transporting ATPase subunit C
MQQLWLTTVPNNKDGDATTFNAVNNDISAKGVGKLYRFEVPNLVVGTLDSLMALSDDLAKINVQVEVISRISLK